MKNIDPLWKDGSMKVVHGVGYENQNLSFQILRNLGNNQLERYLLGWMGRYFEGST